MPNKPPLDPRTGEPLGVKPKLNPRTGEPYNMAEDPLIQKMRAGVQGLFPITRPIADIAATTTGNETLANLNPYSGKNNFEKAMAYASDILGQGVQIAAMTAPGMSPALRATQAGLQAGAGVLGEVGMEELMKDPEFKDFVQGAGGKILGDYVLPIVSIAASAKGIKGFFNRAVPKNEINAFLQKNPDATKDMFNSLNKITNTEEAMSKMGFDASKGKLKMAGDEVVGEIRKNIKDEIKKFGEIYEKIKDVPVKKNAINDIVAKMDEEIGNLGNSAPDTAIRKNIIKYRDLLKKMKNPKLEDVDNIKKDFYKDLKYTGDTFKVSDAERIARDIGRDMIDKIESFVPAKFSNEFKNIKESYGSMAEARNELNSLARISSDKVMQRISDGDKIEALYRLADPKVVNKAIKVTSRAKNPNDYQKTMENYLSTLQKIDQVNEKFAKELFDVKALPSYARMTSETALDVLKGSGASTLANEMSMARFLSLTPQEREKIIMQNTTPKITINALEERLK